MKPIIKYRGKKSKELSQILPYIPSFTGRYIEPFFGGGALFFHLERNGGIINDINKNLIDFYKDIQCNFLKVKEELFEIERIYIENQDVFTELKKQYPNTMIKNCNEDLYYKMREMYNGLSMREYSYGTLYYFINKTAYSGMIRYNSKGYFNVPYGRYKTFNT